MNIFWYLSHPYFSHCSLVTFQIVKSSGRSCKAKTPTPSHTLLGARKVCSSRLYFVILYRTIIMEYFNVRMTFRTRKIGEKVIFWLISIIYIVHIMISTPDQLSSAVPAVHFPCPLYLFLALLREVAEYFVCWPLPILVFLGFDSIVPPIFHFAAIIHKFQ